MGGGACFVQILFHTYDTFACMVWKSQRASAASGPRPAHAPYIQINWTPQVLFCMFAPCPPRLNNRTEPFVHRVHMPRRGFPRISFFKNNTQNDGESSMNIKSTLSPRALAAAGSSLALGSLPPRSVRAAAGDASRDASAPQDIARLQLRRRRHVLQ